MSIDTFDPVELGKLVDWCRSAGVTEIQTPYGYKLTVGPAPFKLPEAAQRPKPKADPAQALDAILQAQATAFKCQCGHRASRHTQEGDCLECTQPGKCRPVTASPAVTSDRSEKIKQLYEPGAVTDG